MWSTILNPLDDVLNRITMYRLVLYILIVFNGLAFGFAWLNLLPFNPGAILISIGFILLVSLVTNIVFAQVFKAPTNTESVYITALILSLIVTPATSLAGLLFTFWASLLAQGSKYLLAIRKKHVFNPAAIGVVLAGWGLHSSASWWVGDAPLAVPVAIGAFLIIRKLRRKELVLGFLYTMLLLSLGFSLINGANIGVLIGNLIFHSSFLFFMGVMLTEPLTSPTTKDKQFIYGTLVGFLFTPAVHIGNFYPTPEQALIIGNLWAYWVSPKQKLILALRQKIQVAPEVTDFVFATHEKIVYKPGQYMEWTVPHQKPDDRGNRRYFTLASSPTEKEVRIGVKLPQRMSSFKRALQARNHAPVVASQLSGDFVLPKNLQQKLAFIAGGIGITPYRSMIKYLVDTKQACDIVLIYANKREDEIVYRDVFDEANRKLGLKTVYYLTGTGGHFDEAKLKQLIPDFQERLFYISGPHTMVTTTERLLKNLRVAQNRIITDFFPGFV